MQKIYAMNRIREVLDEKGIRQTWLADKLGKSFSIVNAYVCNRRQPSLELLFEIAEILQVDPKELIDSKKKKIDMAKEAKARIKINKLLEDSGWRLLDSADGKANVLFETM